MTRLRNLLITVAMVFASIGIASAASSEIISSAPVCATGPKALKIVAFGSSSTQGIGASGPATTYPAQLQALLHGMMPAQRPVSVINRGIAGEDADDMIKRLQRDVIGRRPDLVIFQTGSNDPMRRVPLDRFERETRASITSMQSAGIAVILMEPQWCPTLDKIPAATAYRDVVRKVGATMNIDVIRRSDLMHDWIAKGILTPREMLASDGLHMRDRGYALLAKSVAVDILKISAFRAGSQQASVSRNPRI